MCSGSGSGGAQVKSTSFLVGVDDVTSRKHGWGGEGRLCAVVGGGLVQVYEGQ